MLPTLNRPELQEASSRNDLIIKTAAQIIKDFSEFSLDITFSGQVDGFYDELFQQMKPAIEEVMNEQFSLFQHFLYRIDVSERQIAMYQTEREDDSYIDALTELIIHREMKKVMIREYFKSQTDNQNEDKQINE